MSGLQPTGRRPLDKPFELFLLAICTIYGIIAVLGGPRPQSLQATVEPHVVTIWGWMLAVGGFTALLGIFWRGRLTTSYAIETAGLICIGTATLVYAIAILVSNVQGGLFAGSISIAFSLACFARMIAIHRFAKALDKQEQRRRAKLLQ